MEINDVTIGIAVSDLAASRAWYRRVFELEDADLVIDDEAEEYDLGAAWLQLAEEEIEAGGTQTVVRFGVDDVEAEHDRLAELGIDVSDVRHIPGLIDFFEFEDPDGNLLSLYTVLDDDDAADEGFELVDD